MEITGNNNHFTQWKQLVVLLEASSHCLSKWKKKNSISGKSQGCQNLKSGVMHHWAAYGKPWKRLHNVWWIRGNQSLLAERIILNSSRQSSIAWVLIEKVSILEFFRQKKKLLFFSLENVMGKPSVVSRKLPLKAEWGGGNYAHTSISGFHRKKSNFRRKLKSSKNSLPRHETSNEQRWCLLQGFL